MPESVKLDLSPADLAMWRENITKSREVRKIVSAWWDSNIKKYAPAQNGSPEEYGAAINTNRDFTLVERKKADLFYQRPDVSVIPSPLLADQPQLLETHADILNEKLGLDGVNAKALVHQALFDVLCPSGRGWTEMGYESATVPTPMQVPDEEAKMPGAILGLQQPQQMKTVMAPVPVYEDCFWSWLSPYAGLVPHTAKTSKADAWPWIGKDFEIPTKVAIAKGWVPENFKGSTSDKDMSFDHGLLAGGATDVTRGSLIYYKSSLYRDDRPHPLHQTLLVLIDGQDKPAEHKDSPYQTLDEQGKLTPDSLIGFAIHPLTIRDLTDSAHVPSDCTISRPLVNELNKFREQMVESRDIMLVKYKYNIDVIPKEALDKIVRSAAGGFIGLPGEAFQGENVAEIPHGSYPRENFTVNDYLDNDLARTHAIDAEQSGASSGGDQTATESQIKQNNVNARLGLERGRVLDWYLDGVTKYSTLIQRYLSVEDAAKIVGPTKAQEWDGWRHAVPASLAFTAAPDSSLRTDSAADRRRYREDYTYMANDPFVDRQKLLKFSLPRMGYPTDIFVQQPPEKGPEPVKFSLAIASASLNPMLPEYANLYQILTQQGIKGLIAPIDEALMNQPDANPDTEHGGKVPQSPEPLSKHAAALTGNMQGTGAPAPLGAGGQQ